MATACERRPYNLSIVRDYRGYLLKNIRNSENLKILSTLFYGNNIVITILNFMIIILCQYLSSKLLVNTKF